MVLPGTTSRSVGQLARATGLSVRVLRHWEDMGLVTPERTASGHRRYGPARAYDGEGDGDAATLMKVIETMTMFEQYVHGYQAEENLRLRDQATTLVDLLHDGTAYPPGSRVLEAGCGVGAQTVTLASRSPGAHITALDTSARSLEEARQRAAAAGITTVSFRNADVFTLPRAEGEFEAGMFDHVFVCFLLEHVKAPAEALARLRAMLRPGGTITVIEGDHGSTYFHPDSDAARDAIGCQVTLQRHAGGDAMIGRRLYPLLAGAGYQDIAVSPRDVYADGGHSALADGFIRKTFTPMIEGVREPAVAAGLIEPGRFDEGIRDLYRTAEPDGVFCYTFFKGVAVAP